MVKIFTYIYAYTYTYIYMHTHIPISDIFMYIGQFLVVSHHSYRCCNAATQDTAIQHPVD